MLPRALAPVVLCASATWALPALACINSMDDSGIVFKQTIGLDLLLWPAGAVFMNRVVLVNVWAPIAEEQPGPSWFRRLFFLLVGACLVLLLAAFSAGGPLLGLSAQDLAKCSVDPAMVLMLAAIPMVLFALQAVVFQRVVPRWFGGKGSVALVSLVLTSVLLVLVAAGARDVVVLPDLCQSFSSPY